MVIRKYGQIKGGIKIRFPHDIGTLLKVGNEELNIKAVKVREYNSEAEIKDIEAIKENDIVYLTTEEDEKEFQ